VGAQDLILEEQLERLLSLSRSVATGAAASASMDGCLSRNEEEGRRLLLVLCVFVVETRMAVGYKQAVDGKRTDPVPRLQRGTGSLYNIGQLASQWPCARHHKYSLTVVHNTVEATRFVPTNTRILAQCDLRVVMCRCGAAKLMKSQLRMFFH
jgi:hypothetical protein